METNRWGFFALVSYVPEPLGSFLDQLRQSLPGVSFPKAHITILPPRPLSIPIEEASERAREGLQKFAAFDVELTAVEVFDETSVLFLDLGDGSAVIHDLHDALNAGDLAMEEQFEFRPHLTLGGPVPNGMIQPLRSRVEETWQTIALPKQFKIENIVGLWADPQAETVDWERLWTHTLGPEQTQTAVAGPAGRR